jgi:Cdc6-like AAA superfamily ATPase
MARDVVVSCLSFAPSDVDLEKTVAVANPLKGLFKKKKASKSRRAPPANLAAEQPNISDLFQQTARRSGSSDEARLPRFQSTAADQLDVGRGDRFAQVRLKVRNAFTPSQPVSDRRFFAGRKDVLAQMIRALEDQRQHLVIYGERGIGKTSLLHILTQAAREARYIVVYWSCGSASNFDETFRAAAAEIPLLFHGGFSPTATESETGSSFADLLPPGRTSPRIFGELCAKITGTRVLIILDEFDRCESAEFRREIAELIKILSDRSVRAELVIAGVAADLAELVEHIPSIRRNIHTFKVPLMTPEEVRDLVDTGTRTSGLLFAADATKFVEHAACGSPYLAALICHHASLGAVDAKRAEVVVTDVRAGVAQATTDLRDRIPRAVQRQVNRLLEKGAARPLAVLAAASMAAAGDFDDRDIEKASQTTSEATLCKRLCQEIASDDGLIATVEVDGRTRYRFAEEGLPPYLWLLQLAEDGSATEVSDKRVVGA